MRAARLRDGHPMLARVQPAGCARRDLGHRAGRVHRAGAGPGARRGAGLFRVARADWFSDAEEHRESCVMEAPLLVELLTEELPPKWMPSVAQRFASELFGELTRSGFADIAQRADVCATPRRLAVRLAKGGDPQPLRTST